MVRLLAAINALAFILTLFFWGWVAVFGLVPYPWTMEDSLARSASATTYGFLVGDLLYSAPLLFLAARGLWNYTPWGWLTAQMANGLWLWSMTAVLIRDGFTHFSPGGLLFAPFALIAAASVPYLWHIRRQFGIGNADEFQSAT